MDEPVRMIREFIGAEPVRGTNCFMTTMNQVGLPSFRQVSAFIQGWTVYTVTQTKSLKVKHLHSNPETSYMWVENAPVRRRKFVWMRGKATMIEDPDEVQAFMEHRARVLNFTPPERDWIRYIVKFQPEYLRAEAFLGEEAGNTPVIITDFTLP